MAATMAPEGYGTLVNKLLSAMTYMGALSIFIHSIRRFIPSVFIEDYFYYYLELITRYFTSTLTMVIEEYNGLVSNEIYEAAEIYVGSKMVGSNMPPLTRRIKVSKPLKEEKLSTTMDDSEEVFDVFNGVKFEWSLIRAKKDGAQGNNTIIINNSRNSKSSTGTQKYFTLSFHKKHKQMVLDDYLPYILKEYKSILEEKKTLKIFTINLNGFWNGEDVWSPIKLDHPANFDKLAMDSKLKKTIIDDLDRFVKRKDFYRKVGKAWKRGYLLYGPPGTGKSSLIAAMANYLHFDVYDLELNEIPCNSYLRSILLATANRSILVIEDIDCSVEFESREGKKKKAKKDEDDEEKVTLSGFLNFIDGLWSSIGDERIIVFTTNHKEKLDPALLRPGRMDMHILMSYCTPCGFKTLVSNYLEIKEHHLFEKIEGIIDEAEVTPAEVAEQLMKGDDPDIVLQELVEFLQQKKIEHDEAKKKATREAEEAEKKAKEEKEKKKEKRKKKKKKQDQDDDSDEETSSDTDSSSSGSSSSSYSSGSSSSSSSSSSNSDSSDVDE